MKRRGALMVAAALLVATAAASAHGSERHRGAPARLGLPAPGSYTLPPIQNAGNGWVLEGNHVPRRLSRYTEGAVTLLTFMYTYCSDPDGCPLAHETMQGVKARIERDRALHGRVRLVSLSFDPTNDTPQAMRLYARLQPPSAAVPWHFLTTWSTALLAPILRDYGQDIEIERDAQGRATRAIGHMLKAFLIDGEGRVREIYSADYMDAQLIFNDVKTLALQAARR